jgi:hypothetical protein
MAARRIIREQESLAHYQDKYFTAVLRSERPQIWDVTITTDDESAYGRRNHTLEICMPRNYPFFPPTARFTSPINNECVCSDGQVNLDILQDAWSPAITVGPLIVSIASLLNESDFDYSRQRQIQRVSNFKRELIETVCNTV